MEISKKIDIKLKDQVDQNADWVEAQDHPEASPTLVACSGVRYETHSATSRTAEASHRLSRLYR